MSEQQDTLLASATNCKPTRGVVGRRSTSYTAPPSNYLYVSKTEGSDPAHCVWGGAGNPFL
ncbi:MAG TPA: hypothetical protein VI072_01365, partial [Polyangiaceae bacterium]